MRRWPLLFLVGLFTLSSAAVLPLRADDDKGAKTSTGDKKKKDKKKPAAQAKPQQKKKKKQARKTTDLPPELQAVMKASQPTKEHKQLAAMAGKWLVKGTFWMDPAAPPTKADGVSMIRALHGGRYIQEQYRSKFLGMQFQGMGIVGYDKQKKKYVSVWTDNMSTAIMTMEGTPNDSGDTVTYRGAHWDAASQSMIKTKMVMKMTGDDRAVFDAYSLMEGGKEVQTMRLVYERQEGKKKAAEKKKAAVKKKAVKKAAVKKAAAKKKLAEKKEAR